MGAVEAQDNGGRVAQMRDGRPQAKGGKGSEGTDRGRGMTKPRSSTQSAAWTSAPFVSAFVGPAWLWLVACGDVGALASEEPAGGCCRIWKVVERRHTQPTEHFVDGGAV